MTKKPTLAELLAENRLLKGRITALETQKQTLETILSDIVKSKSYKLIERYRLVKALTRRSVHHPFLVVRLSAAFFSRSPKAQLKQVIVNELTGKYAEGYGATYGAWVTRHYPTKPVLDRQRRASESLSKRPLLSIILPTYNTPITFLKECLDSMINQSYDNWELCIVDDASSEPAVVQTLTYYAQKDKRIHFKVRKQHGHISTVSNDALRMAAGEYVGLLDHDDMLWPNALFEVMSVLTQHKDADLIYSDEDKLDADGKTRVDPFFKPDYSPEYLRCVNYIGHFAVIKTSRLRSIGGFRKGYEGAQDWDLFLRVLDKTQQVYHIPKVLYDWRKSAGSSASTPAITQTKAYAFKIQQHVLEADLARRKVSGEIVATDYPGVWRMKEAITEHPLVSLIIPTKDAYPYISRCLDSILTKTTYDRYELVIVDTGSTDQKIKPLYATTAQKHKQSRIVSWNTSFNFPAVCNFGVAHAAGEYVVLLNNDTEVITPDWIEELLSYAQRRDIGAVGCKLLYPDETIQHAGIILGIKGGLTEKGIAGHAFKYFTNVGHGHYFQQMHSVKNYSAVTAACLMIKKSTYETINGFDEAFRIAFNDVDFCLRLRKAGYRTVYTPFACLYHHESVSIGKPDQGTRDAQEFQLERQLMYDRYPQVLWNDPYYNPNLTLDHEDYGLRLK